MITQVIVTMLLLQTASVDPARTLLSVEGKWKGTGANANAVPSFVVTVKDGAVSVKLDGVKDAVAADVFSPATQGSDAGIALVARFPNRLLVLTTESPASGRVQFFVFKTPGSPVDATFVAVQAIKGTRVF